jgi:hypothetical protein
MHDVSMFVVEPVQILNDRQIPRVEAMLPRGAWSFRRLVSAEAQPFCRHAKPLRERAQFFLGRDCFTQEPFTRCVDGNRRSVETDIEFPCQLGWAVRGVVRMLQHLLQALAKIQPFLDGHVCFTFLVRLNKSQQNAREAFQARCGSRSALAEC